MDSKKESVERVNNTTTMDIVNIDPQGSEAYSPNMTFLTFEVTTAE
jgi:hypothetical protein